MPEIDRSWRPHQDPVLAAICAVALEAGCPLAEGYFVGGVVRDGILGIGAGRFDVDLTVVGGAERWIDGIGGARNAEVVARHRFGTATILLRDVAGQDVHLDVISARRESYDHPGALPTVVAGSLQDDLYRRDVSINAIAASADPTAARELVDPTGGLDDLRDGIVRVLHNQSFVDDPTRLVRVVRYASRLAFTVDASTGQLFDQAVESGVLQTISGQRLAAELSVLLASPAREWVGIPHTRKLLAAVAPWLEALACRDGDHNHVWLSSYATELDHRHGVQWVDRLAGCSAGVFATEWAIDGDALSIHVGEAQPGWPALASLLDHLGVSAALRTRASLVLAACAIGRALASHGGADADSSVWLERADTLFDGADRDLVSLCAGAAEAVRSGAGAAIEDYLIRREAFSLQVDGSDVLSRGVGRGPQVGSILAALRQRCLAGAIHGRSEQLAELDELVGATVQGERQQ